MRNMNWENEDNKTEIKFNLPPPEIINEAWSEKKSCEINNEVREEYKKQFMKKKERFIFGHPTRETTLEFFPNKVSLDEYCDYIKENIDTFRANLKHLDNFKDKEQYVEQWLETMAAWMEIEPNWQDVEAGQELLYREIWRR